MNLKPDRKPSEPYRKWEFADFNVALHAQPAAPVFPLKTGTPPYPVRRRAGAGAQRGRATAGVSPPALSRAPSAPHPGGPA